LHEPEHGNPPAGGRYFLLCAATAKGRPALPNLAGCRCDENGTSAQVAKGQPWILKVKGFTV